jgi:hypothetical protein
MLDEDWTSGHLAMCGDFDEAVAQDHPPLATGQLGLEVLRVAAGWKCTNRPQS